MSVFSKISIFAIHAKTPSWHNFLTHSGEWFQNVLFLVAKNAVLVWPEGQTGDTGVFKCIWISLDGVLNFTRFTFLFVHTTETVQS